MRALLSSSEQRATPCDEGDAGMFALDRRSLLAVAAAGFVTACAGAKSDRLIIGDQRGGIQSMLKIAGQLGDLPYAIDWAQFPNAAPLLEALTASALDSGIGGDAAYIFSLQAGTGVKAIAAIRSTGSAIALMVPKGSPIRHFSDLIGKKVATPKGSIGHHVLLAGLDKMGKPFDAIDISFLSPNDGRAALLSGSVDAWSIWNPYAAIGELNDGMRPVPVEPGLASGVSYLFASEKAFADKRRLLVDLAGRFERAVRWIAAHRVDYAHMVARETGVPLPIMLLSVERGSIEPASIDDALRREQQGIADLYFKAGLMKRRVDVRESLVDLSADN